MPFSYGVYQALQANGGSLPKLFHRGIPDRFICHGTRQEVLDLVGLSREKLLLDFLEILGNNG